MPVYGIYRMILEVVGHDQTGGLFKRISSGFSSIMQYATAIVGAMIFERIASGIGQVVSASVEAVAYMQQMDVALTQLSAREMVQTGAATSIADAWERASQKGDELLVRLQDIAILSPYTVESVTQTYKMAMAFGFTTEEAMTFTEALLENAAGIGADNSMLDRMAYNLAQVRLQGKVTALDVRQLALAGFDLVGVLKYVGKQMGVEIKTHLDFNEAIASGKITWADFTKYFAQYADENFGGASERMARTLMGLKSTFHDVFVLTMPKVLGPAAQVITDYLNGLLNKFIAFRDSGELEKWAEPITNAAKRIVAVLTILFEFPSKPAAKFRAILAELFPYETAEKIFSTVRTLWRIITTIWNTGATIVGDIIENLKKVFGGLKTFWDQNGGAITEAFGKVFKSFNQEVTGVKPSWIDIIFMPLQNLITWLVENGPKITEVLGSVASFVADKLFPAITKIVTFLASNWRGIATFFLVFKYGVGLISGAFKVFTAIRTAIQFIGLLTSTALGPILLIVGAIALLAAAWANNWGGIREKTAAVWAWLQPILKVIVTWVGEKLGIAIAWLANVWQTVLLPAIQTVWAWIQANVFPILQQLWTWLQTNIPIAIAWLANVWNTILLPAIQTVWNWISTVLIPLFLTIWTWLSTTLTAAIQTLSNFWTMTLLPAIQTAIAWIQENVVPIFTAIATVISTVLGAAISWLSWLWSNFLLPAIQAVWGFISGSVIPLFQAIAELISTAVSLAFTVLAGIFENVVLPAVKGFVLFWINFFKPLWDAAVTIFNEKVIPALKSIAEWVGDKVTAKFQALSDLWNTYILPAIQDIVKWWEEELRPVIEAALTGWLGNLKTTFDNISTVISNIIEFIKTLIEKLKNVKLPAWIVGNSPSPFELSLMGVNTQLELMATKRIPNVRSALNSLPSNTPGFNASTTGNPGGLVVQVSIDSIGSNVDVDRMAYTIARTIQRNRGNG